MLKAGLRWNHLPTLLGFGSGATCWRRLSDWQKAGVWARLHELLLDRLREAGQFRLRSRLLERFQTYGAAFFGTSLLVSCITERLASVRSPCRDIASPIYR